MATVITHCTIRAGEPSLDLDTDDGHVVIVGEPPHAVATLSWWQEEEGDRDSKTGRWITYPVPMRPVRRDRIIEAEVKTRNGITEITGTSEFLANEVGADDYQITVKVGPSKGCKDC